MMIGIILSIAALVLLLVVMARRSRGRSRRNFVAIPFQGSLALGTLADNTTVLAGALGANLTEDLFVISADIAFTMAGHTAGEGSFEVGTAHGDLAASEVQEALDAEVINPSDIIAKERARRPVRRYGVFLGVAATEVLFDGQLVRKTHKFSVGETNLNIFATNRSGGAYTTGTVVQYQGTIYGRWQI